MVVGFLVNNEDGDGDNGVDGKHLTRKKYLVARSSEQTNSIFDYVHLSTTLLRKVRFGQPVELAIQKPLKGAKRSIRNKKKQLTNLKDVSSFESWATLSFDTEVPQQQQQQSQQQASRQNNSKTLSIRSKTGPSPQARKSSAPLIRYGHVVRFQAADGGFLLVESDGCLRKVPNDHASDPRTLITLFPRDPIANVGKQNNRRVHSGDWAFIVQGSAAALETELGIARADSDEMVEGPAYLVDEVARHDDLAAVTASAICHPQQHDQDNDQPEWRQNRHTSKQAIRKKQLEHAFPQETECTPTTVWCLQKVVSRSPGGVASSQSPLPRSDKLSASLGRERHDNRSSSCLKHDTQLQIFQNNFVVCYELQSSKDDDEENGNDNKRSRRRSSAMSSFPLGIAAAPAMVSEKAPGSGVDSRSSPQETLSSEGQPSSGPLSSSLGHSNESGSIFTHVWLQETQEFAGTYHPTKCSCSVNITSDSSCNSDRRKAIWDNTWTICDINVVESRSSRDPSLPLGSPQHDKVRRRSKPSATTTITKVEPLASVDSSKSEEPKAPGAEDDELDPLSEELKENDGDETDEEEQESLLQRQASVFDVTKFTVKAETQQARAARIIVRFFRRLFRDEVTQSRVQDFLRRRRRLTFTKKNVETKLSTKQQLKLLQCYNPNLYGSGGGGAGSTRWQQQQRGLLTFDKFISSAEADRQKLATMKCEVDYLNRDWLRTERHSVQKMTSISHEMYSHRPLSSPFTSKRILANREREQHFHVEMKMAKRDPPSFHYGGFQAAPAPRRPQTAPLANDLLGSKSP